jgi:hypothetical protein
MPRLVDALTKEQITSLLDRGVNPYQLGAVSQKDMPYTSAGATQLQGIGVDSLNRGLLGVNISEVNPTGAGYTGRSYVLMNRDQSPKEFKNTLAHEMEHALAAQGLEPQGRTINKEWDKLSGDHPTSDRSSLVKRLAEHAPYLQEKWGLDPEAGYFSSKIKGANPNLLEEQFASLSALEQEKNKRLTDDPYVRKHIFVTPEQRAAYNALTGLRQSRLDAKDLPPYTPQPDKSDPTMMDRVKSLFGYANGGYIPNAGNNKLI